MKKDKSIIKLFLPMFVSVVITILICLFSKLFVQDFRMGINYIFIGLIYIYLYISMYLSFNDSYYSILKIYFKILHRIHLINILIDLSKAGFKNKRKLLYVYLIVTFSIVAFILFIWQLILEVQFISVTSIICLVIFLILFILSIIMSNNMFGKKNRKKLVK